MNLYLYPLFFLPFWIQLTLSMLPIYPLLLTLLFSALASFSCDRVRADCDSSTVGTSLSLSLSHTSHTHTHTHTLWCIKWFIIKCLTNAYWRCLESDQTSEPTQTIYINSQRTQGHPTEQCDVKKISKRCMLSICPYMFRLRVFKVKKPICNTEPQC